MRKTILQELPGIWTHKAPLGNLLLGRNHPLDVNETSQYSLVVCVMGVFRALTMESTVWVCWRSGSGSREMWTHSGMVTVPPSRSAMITSNWKTHVNTLFISETSDKKYSSMTHTLITATERQIQTKSSLSTAAHYNKTVTFLCRRQERLPIW